MLRKGSTFFDQPFMVQVGYKVNGVGEIDMSKSIFEIDCKIFLFWCDERAIGKPSGVSINLLKEGLFDPDIFVTNDHNLKVVSIEPRVTNSATGEIKCTIHYRGTAFVRAMDLSLFPFDCQNLQLCLQSKSSGVGKLILLPRTDECALEHHVVHEWNILNHKLNAFFAKAPNGVEYSTMFISVLAQRQSGWFINNVFVVSSALLAFACSSYLSPPEERGGKVDIIVCSVIASIANKFVVGDELPKVPYRTLVDMYVDLCFGLIMVSMSAVFLVYYFQTDYYHEKHAEHETITIDHENITSHSGVAAEPVNVTPEGERLAWLVNWCMLGGSFGVFLLFHIWLYFQVASVNQDVSLWLNFDVRNSSMLAKSKRLFVRKSHFLDVAGHKVHHSMLTQRAVELPAIEDEPVTPDLIHQLVTSNGKLQPILVDDIPPTVNGTAESRSIGRSTKYQALVSPRHEDPNNGSPIEAGAINSGNNVTAFATL